jgi:hypothetical protein
LLIVPDPYKDGALALYNIFNDNMAVFFDSAGGHTIPRKGKLLEELSQSVRELITNVYEDDLVELPKQVAKTERLDSAVDIPMLANLKLGDL